MTSGKKYWSDGVPVAGQQFEYGYDDIGNREYAGEGGNEWGSGLRYERYTVNPVNHYTQRTVPGYVDVLGSAKSNATVTVNDTSTYRKGEYFRGELPVTNNIGPIWISVTNLAVLKDGSNPDIVTNTIGNLFVPKTPEAFTHDLDGNQTSDGRWTNRWDAENRLIAVESLSTTPDGAKRKLVFGYDWQGRRTSKLVSNYVAGSWVLASNVRFVYDQWNLLAELNATNNAVINSYIWGLDLSGTEHGAGGVGGLLTISSTGNGTHFFSFDGNGNVITLTSSTNGAVTAEYEYDPFLNPLRATGPMASLNSFTGSGKYWDDEIGAYYYGYRYLRDGWWLSRDPIGEVGGRNLYAAVDNNLVDQIDVLGLRGGKSVKGVQYSSGHHLVPVSIWGKKKCLRKSVHEIFNYTVAVVGVDEDDFHNYAGHGEYTKRVRAQMKKYLDEKGIALCQMTDRDALTFLNRIRRGAGDWYIQGFNKIAPQGALATKNWVNATRRSRINKVVSKIGKVVKVAAIGSFVMYLSDGGVVYAIEQTGKEVLYLDVAEGVVKSAGNSLAQYIEENEIHYNHPVAIECGLFDEDEDD